MTLTLSDIERWDPQAIRTVFEAAIKRAHGTYTASAALTETMRLLTFSGATAEAAHTATHRAAALLDSHADICDAVGRAAEKSAEEVAAIKWRLQVIRVSARDCHLSINDATGAVLPPSDLSLLSAGAQATAFAEAVRLTESIKRLLADAECADEDLTAALRGALGDLSPEQVNAQLSHAPPIISPPPAPGSDPHAVQKWWHSLSPSQQGRVKQWFPHLLRNLDGIPTDIRHELNLPVLRSEICRLQQGWLDDNGSWCTSPGKLADLNALETMLSTHPEARIILLDTTVKSDKALMAVGFGDVDSAECVGVTVGGFNTRASSSVNEMANEAEAQRSKARALRTTAHLSNPGAVASIAWLGYDAPDSPVEVLQDRLARQGAQSLNSFYKALAATSNASEQHITAFGHSYGSLVTSLALQQGTPVSDVVLYGSPGAELTNATQLGVQPGHAYYEIGINDVVAEVVPLFGVFGCAPQEVPGMIELSTNAGIVHHQPWDRGQLYEPAAGHSEYTRLGSNAELRMSGYNMAAVLAGLPEDLVRPPGGGVAPLPHVFPSILVPRL